MKFLVVIEDEDFSDMGAKDEAAKVKAVEEALERDFVEFTVEKV